MIKFFRHIRQNLLNEGKTSKYFKYAIGEIILVVIGILIALQINNWNSLQNDRDIEQSALKNLKTEFEENLEQLRIDNELNQASLDAAYSLLQSERITYQINRIDSLLGTALNYATFEAGTGVFDEAISSGKMRLIQNDSLKTLLSKWKGKLNEVGEDEIIRRDHIIHNASPLFRKYIPYRNFDRAYDRKDYMRNRRIEPIEISITNYEKFFQSIEVDGALYEIYLNQSYIHSISITLENYIEEVLILLDKNIE
jgi:hypothetical protein